MKYHFLSTVFLSVTISTSYAQNPISVTDTTSFKQAFDKMLAFTPNEQADTSLQLAYAGALFQFYIDQPTMKYADYAVGTAFKVWGNLGAVEEVNAAMDQIPEDREIWSYFVEFIPGAFGNHPEYGDEDILQLLQRLSLELTHPLAISRVYWLMSSYYAAENDEANLVSISQKMINLNAIPAHVEIGLAHIRSLDSLQVGQQAPSFLMESLSGVQINVPSDKLILLDFWATWCGPCIAELPTLKKIERGFSTHDIEIVGISWDQNDEVLNAFVVKNEIFWQQILQNEESGTELNQKYGVVGIPSTFLIDTNGVIVARYLRGDDLISKIELLLK